LAQAAARTPIVAEGCGGDAGASFPMGVCRRVCRWCPGVVALLSVVLGFLADSPVHPDWTLLGLPARDWGPPMDAWSPLPSLALCWVAAWESGHLDNFTAANIRHFHKAYPQFMRNATLWVDNKTRVPPDVQAKVRVRILPPGFDGKIGKTYALRYSEPMDTSHVLFLDGDTWVCPGWLEFLYRQIQNLTVDVFWTITPIKCGRYVDFKCDVMMDHKLRENATAMKEFVGFAERNSGTVFAIKRSHKTTRWLSDAADLYPRMVKAKVVLGDQPALRESFFWNRRVLKEAIIDENLGCRANFWKLPLHLQGRSRCRCKCSCTTCLFIHNKQEFPECAKELGVWEAPP